jgi:hypothetical protein
VTADIGTGLDAATRLAVARVAVEHGRLVRLAIRGRSMLPLLREPMTIEVRALRGAARTGDVLVFRAGDVYVAHRVIGRAGEVYFTCGDAQPDVVERVEPAELLGRVEAVWSDASPGAVRVDSAFHRLRGLLYAHVRTARLLARRLAGRVRRLRAKEI